MLVVGVYHLPCQFVILFFFYGLVMASYFYPLHNDKICQFAPIFGTKRVQP